MRRLNTAGSLVGEANFAKLITINDIRTDITALANLGVALGRTDIVDCLCAREFKDRKLMGVWVRRSLNGERLRINPTLSFVFDRNTAKFFENQKEIASSLKEFGVGSGFKLESVEPRAQAHNVLILSKDEHTSEKDLVCLVDCLAVIYQNSVNAANIHLNTGRRISTLLSSVFNRNPNDNIETLLSKALLSGRKLLRSEGTAIKLDTECRLSGVNISNDKLGLGSSGQEVGSGNPSISYDIKALSKDLRSIKCEVTKSYEEMITVTFDLKHSASSFSGLSQPMNPNFGLLQPINIGGELEGDRYFVILVSESRFLASTVSHLSQFATSFQGIYRRNAKLRLLTEINASEASQKLNSTGLSYSQISNDFAPYVSSGFESLFSLIQCHSVTLRFFNPQTNALDVIVARTSTTGGADQTHGSIPVSRYRDSVNAFTYLVASQKNDYVYIQNLDGQIPQRYRQLGLDGTYRVREASKSELCIPFRVHDVCIGTLNLEAVNTSAFDQDIDFLISFRNTLQSRYLKYFETTDVGWMKRMSRFADPLHELSNYLQTDLFTDDQKSILRRLFWDGEHREMPTHIHTLGGLKAWIGSWVPTHFDRESDDLLEALLCIIEVNGSSSLEINPKIIDVLQSIIKNLVINVVNYSFVEMDKIIVSTDPMFKSLNSTPNEIRVRFKTFGPFDADDLDAICLRPIQRSYDMDRPEHFGMFTLGLLVRSVGGVAIVCPPTAEKETVIEFRLPRNAGL